MEFRIAIIAVGAAIAAPVAAQPSESVAAAEQLFEEARTLAQNGEFAAACPRFEASYKLDPALGTLLNMATCYENLGQLASAWGRYREVVAVAMKVGDEARVTIARERADAIEPRLPRLAIRGSGAKIAGLAITRDDIPVDPAVLGAGIYVDPGEHVVTASAPGHKPFTTRVTVIERESKVVEIPQLEIDPEAAKPAAITTFRVEEDPGRTRRLGGMILGGAGLATLATGLGFGLAARSAWQDAFDAGLCDSTSLQCTSEGQTRTNEARRHALVADVVTGAGIAMVAAGVVLYLTAPEHREVAVTPIAGGGAAVSFGGNW